METNWITISIIIFFAILILIYLIRKNLKDEKKVMKHFNKESSFFKEEESEFNDEN